jgi:hypothetical protein
MADNFLQDPMVVKLRSALTRLAGPPNQDKNAKAPDAYSSHQERLWQNIKWLFVGGVGRWLFSSAIGTVIRTVALRVAAVPGLKLLSAMMCALLLRTYSYHLRKTLVFTHAAR